MTGTAAELNRDRFPITTTLTIDVSTAQSGDDEAEDSITIDYGALTIQYGVYSELLASDEVQRFLADTGGEISGITLTRSVDPSPGTSGTPPDLAWSYLLRDVDPERAAGKNAFELAEFNIKSENATNADGSGGGGAGKVKWGDLSIKKYSDDALVEAKFQVQIDASVGQTGFAFIADTDVPGETVAAVKGLRNVQSLEVVESFGDLADDAFFLGVEIQQADGSFLEITLTDVIVSSVETGGTEHDPDGFAFTLSGKGDLDGDGEVDEIPLFSTFIGEGGVTDYRTAMESAFADIEFIFIVDQLPASTADIV